MIRRPPRSTLFPYTTSSDLVSAHVLEREVEEPVVERVEPRLLVALAPERLDDLGAAERLVQKHGELGHALLDRKSTRLNSSHLVISYAVFCLQKKKTYIHSF